MSAVADESAAIDAGHHRQIHGVALAYPLEDDAVSGDQIEARRVGVGLGQRDDRDGVMFSDGDVEEPW